MAETKITVVLVVGIGGARLQRSLETVAEIGQVLALDPTGQADTTALPEDVVCHSCADVDARIRRGWILFLNEGERVSPQLRREIEAVVTDDGAPACRVAIEHRAFGGRLRSIGAPVRLVRQFPRWLGMSAEGQLAAEPGHDVTRRLRCALEVHIVTRLTDSVAEFDRDATVWAALSADHVGPVGVFRTVRIGASAFVRTLIGRGGNLGWGRLILSVLHGYRTVLAHTRIWEARRGSVA